MTTPTETPVKTPIQLAGEVARGVELTGVSVTRWTSQFQHPTRRLPAFKAKVDVTLSHEEEAFVDGALFVEAKFKMTGTETELGDDAAIVEIATTIVLKYDFVGDYRPTAEALQAFAHLNAAMNAWPYMREVVQSSTAKMGLPPFVVPLFRLSKG